MKKTGVLFLVWILLLTFAACGGNATVAEAQEEVVSIGEKFLTGNLNADKAVAQLETVDIPQTEGNGYVYLAGDINHLAYMIDGTQTDEITMDQVREKVDWIKNSDYGD